MLFILKHQGEEQEHPEGQQEAEREQQAEEESAAGLKELPGRISWDGGDRRGLPWTCNHRDVRGCGLVGGHI